MDANRKLGISFLALFVATLLPAELRAADAACPSDGAITLRLHSPASWELRRGMVLTNLLLFSNGGPFASLPGPEIRVPESCTFEIRFENDDLVEAHTFDIPGLSSTCTGCVMDQVPPNGVATFEVVTGPRPGTFYYTGATAEERDRGMYGAFSVGHAVVPLAYGLDAQAIDPEFDYVHFYDEIARDPADTRTTTPALNPTTHVKPTNATHEFILNGSTIDATVAGENLDANIIHGEIGVPLVIRTISVGSETHAPHGHGHLFQATDDGLTTDGLTPAGPAPTIPTDVPRMPSGVVRNLYMLPRSVGVWPLHCHQETHLLNGVEAEYPGGEFTHIEFTDIP